MISLVGKALFLAQCGLKVFPLIPGSKKPMIENFPERATIDEKQIYKWWNKTPMANIGISTTDLIALDIDAKSGKDGYSELKQLMSEGLQLVPTFEQLTPTGGRHLIYKTTEKFSQRPLSKSIDIRAHHGYLVGAGSVIDGKEYTIVGQKTLADAPPSLIDRLKKIEIKTFKKENHNVDQEKASTRVVEYLLTDAPVAVQGERGDETTFKVACKIKDFGLNLANAKDALTDLWNDRCIPPWGIEELHRKIENAYSYGQESVGSKSPDVLFPVIKSKTEEKVLSASSPDHPILELNKNYAFLIIKGKSSILYESTDNKGKFNYDCLNMQAFKDKMLPHTLMFNDKKHQLADLWLKSPNRRSFDGMCFDPSNENDKRLYNLWKGFAFTPKSCTESKAVKMFCDHVFKNICDSDKDLYTWLMGFLAHLVQKPGEKPFVALVLRGGKGVGKNAFIDIIGKLLGNHYSLTSDVRYLTGNFNSIFENCLMMVFDEAFWAGNKQGAEGKLKDIVTGETHLIERKGFEPYPVKNCTRVVIIGNEDWLVPASNDERRFAVFNVAKHNQQDTEFFSEMKANMKAGGYAELLHHLQSIPLDGINVNRAPITEGLAEQKVKSLPPLQEWWLECLTDGCIVDSGMGNGEWPDEINRDTFRYAYQRHMKERNIFSRGETPVTIGKALHKFLPSIIQGQKKVEGSRINTYKMPPLDVARSEWDTFIGHKTKWPPN